MANCSNPKCTCENCNCGEDCKCDGTTCNCPACEDNENKVE